MNPPRALIERMLKDGYIGCLVSVFCLTAAYSAKRGLPIEGFVAQNPLTHEPLDAKHQGMARDVMASAYEDFKSATPAELDFAISLYSAHLKAAGYNVEIGRVDN